MLSHVRNPAAVAGAGKGALLAIRTCSLNRDKGRKFQPKGSTRSALPVKMQTFCVFGPGKADEGEEQETDECLGLESTTKRLGWSPCRQ